MDKIKGLTIWVIERLKAELPPQRIIDELRKVDVFEEEKFIVRCGHRPPIFEMMCIDMTDALNRKPNERIVPKKLSLDYLDCLDLLELELQDATRKK